MQINFTNTHRSEEDLTQELTAFAQRKLISLKKYLREGKDVAQVYVEVGKQSGAHQQGDIWRTHINLDKGGKRFHAEATGETIHTAMEAAINRLEHELQSLKSHKKGMIKSGGSALKSFLRGFSAN